MKRTKLIDRKLPSYTHGEEIMNMVTHIVGGGFALIAMCLCIAKTFSKNNLLTVLGACIYGISLVTLYTMSSIYHGLKTITGKKVLQIIDHCMIYLLIAGTYTPILLTSFVPVYPIIGWGLLILQWGLGSLAATLTAIDLRKYRAFSMICYIFMGWSIIFFLPQVLIVLKDGFPFILWGGIAYTIGAILFGIGSKVHWLHAVFHIFVVIGSFLQFLGIYFYVL